jgi:hypothetical protein
MIAPLSLPANCRSGSVDCGGNIPDNVAWYADKSGNAPHAVALKSASELGLHDMSGNVGEMLRVRGVRDVTR